MTVLRMVVDLPSSDPGASAAFYRELLGLEIAMDQGWIVTLAAQGATRPQISLMTEGGAGAPVPAVSIEVDDFDATLARARAMTAPIVYGPVEEAWGVRRFFVRDPDGALLNILTHTS